MRLNEINILYNYEFFTESMEQNFKKQLVERQEYVATLLKESKEKEKEFQEYCRQVEIDRKFTALLVKFKNTLNVFEYF